MKPQISKAEVAFFVLTLVASCVAARYVQPLIHGDKEAIGLIATVFSILAGLLVGIITLVADTSSLPGKTWRGVALARPILRRRLYRHRVLFLVYLVTLLLILAALIVDDGSGGKIVKWLERVYIFFAAVGFAYSLRLPWTLARMQEERLNAAIEERRQQAGAAASGVTEAKEGRIE